MKSAFIALTIAVFTVAGCKSNRPNDQQADAKKMENTLDKTDITNKYWKLITLDGKPETMARNQERERYFTLKTDRNWVEGFAGCNSFNTTYTLEKGNRIRFSPTAATLKACPDVDVNEQAFFEVFGLADNYTVRGDTLSLNVGRRAPLAMFKAVDFN